MWADRPEELLQDPPRPEDLPPGIDPPRQSASPSSREGVRQPHSAAGQPGIFHLAAVATAARARAAAGRQLEDPTGSRALFQAGVVCRRRRGPADLDVVRYWDLAATEKTEFNDPIGRSASSSAATRTAAFGCWIWCAGGPTRVMSNDCCSIPPRRTATGSHRLRQGPGTGRQDPGVSLGARAQWLHRNAGPGKWQQAHQVRTVQFAVSRRQREDPARPVERGAVPRARRLPRSFP